MQPAVQSISLIRFGVYEANLSSGELRKNGVKVKLQELPFRALKLLLSRPYEVVSRDQLRQALWPEGVFVDFDHGISSAMNRLRDALGDSADNPIFIETVERRGYRWIAPVIVPTPPVQPGPVLVNPVRVTPMEKPESPAQVPSEPWRWSLVFPAVALLLVIWILWPSQHSANANSVTPLATSPVSRHAANPEAEQFYLRGRFYWQKRTADDLNKAVDAFTQAIVHDPAYAPAYVGLANCYNLLREYTKMPASEAYPRALAAARKAIELDDQSSDAHASLAFALFYGNWDALGAEREFRRAMELQPNNAVAHHWYATYLSTVGRHSEALGEIERAQALDPASKAILADKGDLLWIAGRRDEAMTLLKQLEASEPDFISPHRYLRGFYFAAGDYSDSLEEWKQEASLMHDAASLKLWETAKKGYVTRGFGGMLVNTLSEQKKLCASGTTSPYLVAGTSALLGNTQEALHYLKTAYDQHDEYMLGAPDDPTFKNLRDELAFRELVAKLNFPKPQ